MVKILGAGEKVASFTLALGPTDVKHRKKRISTFKWRVPCLTDSFPSKYEER